MKKSILILFLIIIVGILDFFWSLYAYPTSFDNNNSNSINGKCTNYYTERVFYKNQNGTDYIILINGNERFYIDSGQLQNGDFDVSKFIKEYNNGIMTVRYINFKKHNAYQIVSLSDENNVYLSLEDTISSNETSRIIGIIAYILVFSLTIIWSWLSSENEINTIIQKRKSKKRKELKKKKRQEELAHRKALEYSKTTKKS